MAISPKLQERTKQDWAQRAQEVAQYNQALPDRIKQLLLALERVDSNTPLNQLQHSLQTATRAARSGASEELIVAALCHDIAKTISVENHASVAAEILKPFVAHSTYEVLRTHTDFQAKYFHAHLDVKKDCREQYRRQPWYSLACQFADEWDMPARDPDYDSYSLEDFSLLLDKTFATPKAQSSSSSPLRLMLLNLRQAAVSFLRRHNSA